VLICNSRLLSPSPLIAWTALTIKLTITPVSLNDRAADRQAHTHALRLGRVEGFKEA